MVIPNQLTMAMCTFEIVLAENGFIFGTYQICDDSYLCKVAKDPQELERFVREWAQERAANIIEWAIEAQKRGENHGKR